MGNVLVAADVERFAVAAFAHSGDEKRTDRVVNVDEVANLGAVAENLNLLVFDRQPDEPRDKALSIVFDQLARAIDIGQPQRRSTDAEDVVVDEMVVLAGRLIDPVDVSRPNQMFLGDWQIFRLAIDLTGARIHHLDAGIVPPARLEQRQLAVAVDLEVGMRVAHAVDVADLPGEVEDDLAIAHEIVHRARLTDVGDIDANAVLDACDVEEIAAVIGNERIDKESVGAERRKPVGKVAADEACCPCDENFQLALCSSTGYFQVSRSNCRISEN